MLTQLITKTVRRRGYQPGWLAKLSVIAAAAFYFVGVYLGWVRGAELDRGACLHLAVPLVSVVPAWVVGHVASFLARRRQRAGDLAFSAAMFAISVVVAVASHAM